MSKRKWHTKAIYLGIALVMALSLVLVGVAGADPGTSKWTKVATPEENGTDNVIRTGSDLKDFAVGPDGETIYVIGQWWDANVGAYVPKLWKSTNGGETFSDKTKAIQKWDATTGAYVTKAEDLPACFAKFSAVAVSPDDADFVAVGGTLTTGAAGLVVSQNGAAKFVDTGLGTVATAAGVSQVTPRCLDISKTYDDMKAIAVGAVDSATAPTLAKVFVVQVGGIALSWKDATLKPGWDSKGTGSIAVTSLAFSPAYATDKTLVTVTNDGNNAYVQNLKWATEKAWNAAAVFGGFPVKIDDVIGFSDIALPSDYMGGKSATRTVFGILTGVVGPTDAKVDERGTVVSRLYQVDNTTVSLPCGPAGLYASIAYYGTIEEGKAMVSQFAAGWPLAAVAPTPTDCCKGLQVWRTTEITDCCPKWSKAAKKPSGQLWALVDYTPDGTKAYATTMGSGVDTFDESAFSVSLNDGKVWNQLSLIDTNIDRLTDVAISPDCNVTYIASVNTATACGCDSVWRLQEEAEDYAGAWMRVFYPSLAGEVGLLRLAEDATDGVYVALIDQGTKNLWTSDNSGETWGSKTAGFVVQDFAVESAEVIHILNSGAEVRKSTDDGWTWSSAVDTKITGAHTIAVLPEDNVLVAPSDAGNRKVAYSSDGGKTFSRTEKLPAAATGNVHVAFDVEFATNDTIYAVVDNELVYRWVIDVSTSWKDLNAAANDYYGVVVGKSEGTLYAAYNGGVARCLGPAATPCCAKEVWDYLVTKAKDFTVEPSSLKICGCLTAASDSELKAIDNAAYDFDASTGCVWTYTDCFAKSAPKLVGPADGADLPADPCECYNEKFTLMWDRQCNACEYDIQISLDEGFSKVVRDTLDFAVGSRLGPGGFYEPAKGSAPSLVVVDDMLDCNTAYWWRVRVRYAETDETIRTPWSDKWSFTIAAGPAAAIDLRAPDDGASDVAITGVGFTWTAVAEATSYDFVLSPNADLSSPVETKTGVTGTAYTYTGTLGYSTPYFWQVTAMMNGSVLSKSSTATFTTVAEPPEPPPIVPPEPPPPTPAWVWVLIGIGAVLVIVTLVLIFRTRRV